MKSVRSLHNSHHLESFLRAAFDGLLEVMLEVLVGFVFVYTLLVPLTLVLVAVPSGQNRLQLSIPFTLT